MRLVAVVTGDVAVNGVEKKMSLSVPACVLGERDCLEGKKDWWMNSLDILFPLCLLLKLRVYLNPAVIPSPRPANFFTPSRLYIYILAAEITTRMEGRRKREKNFFWFVDNTG